jgi:hypothetical protein
MEIVEKIKAEMAVFDEKRKALAAELQKNFPELFKEFFAKHAWVESFKWRQYTPYFNDGDECTFGVRQDYDDIDINEVNHWDDDKREERKPVYKELSDILTSVPEEFYKDLFGDHVEVLINRDGTVETDEYDHD